MQSFALVFDVLRVFLVVVHLLAMAVAVGLVFWQDLALLSSQRLNALRFKLSTRRVTRALIGLWSSGLAILALDTGLDFTELVNMPKMQAKLLVVSLLSLNGLALHCLAFPALVGAQMRWPLPRTAAAVSVLGAISTVSWLYALFLGAARPLTQTLGFGGFIGLYISLVLVAATVALVYVRPHVQRLMGQPAGFTQGRTPAIMCSLARAETAKPMHQRESLKRPVPQVVAVPRETGHPPTDISSSSLSVPTAYN